MPGKQEPSTYSGRLVRSLVRSSCLTDSPPAPHSLGFRESGAGPSKVNKRTHPTSFQPGVLGFSLSSPPPTLYSLKERLLQLSLQGVWVRLGQQAGDHMQLWPYMPILGLETHQQHMASLLPSWVLEQWRWVKRSYCQR